MKKCIFITVLVIVLGIVGFLISFPVRYFYFGHVQVKAGRTVLNGLTQNNIKVWEDRSLMFWGKLESYADENLYGMGHLPLPKDLEEMKVLKIFVSIDCIIYTWLGGMNNCSLMVERNDDGYMHFTAFYDEDTKREIFKIPLKQKFSSHAPIIAR